MGYEVVGLGLLLLGSGQLQKLDVVAGVVLAVDQLVDFFLATDDVGVTLEQALPHVVEDRQTQGFNLGTV